MCRAASFQFEPWQFRLRPLPPVSAEILRISGRGSWKETIFVLGNEISRRKAALPPPCTPPGTVIARKGFGPLALPYGVLTAATLQRGAGELIAMRKNVKPFSSRKRKRIDKSQGKEARRLRLAASGAKTGACAGRSERMRAAGSIRLIGLVKPPGHDSNGKRAKFNGPGARLKNLGCNPGVVCAIMALRIFDVAPQGLRILHGNWRKTSRLRIFPVSSTL